MGKKRDRCRISIGNSEEKIQYEGLDVARKIILKRILG
jgi:hypothetical protein